MVDDFDLLLRQASDARRGSAGTYNGLRSIVAEMGTQKWARLRVGIGVGADGHGGSARAVLTRFASDEERQLPMLPDAAADAVEVWAVDGLVRAADRFNAPRGCRRAEATAPGADKGWPMGRRPRAPTRAGPVGRRPRRRQGLAGGPTAPAPTRAGPVGPTTPGDRRPNDRGIVRTATGWRRLLERGAGYPR
ncbi:MAG: aminoacyl-tRNA hydrolase [Chloroflexota bacterium]